MCLILRARCCLQGKLGEVFVMQNRTFVEMIDFSAGPLIVICLRPYTLESLWYLFEVNIYASEVIDKKLQKLRWGFVSF